MALLATDEPLDGSHLIVLYSVQSEYGTPVTPANAVGLVRADITSDADLKKIFGPGASTALFFKGGIASVEFDFTFEAIQDAAFWLNGIRSSEAPRVLPWLTIGVGLIDDADTVWGWQIQDCKIGEMDIEAEADDFQKGSVRGIGGAISPLSGVTPANIADSPIYSYEILTTRNGAAFPTKGFKISLNNNIRKVATLRGTARETFKRGWDYLTEGNVDVTGEITRYRSTGVNMQADVVATADLVLTAASLAGGSNITATVYDAAFGQERFAGGAGEDAIFTIPFEARNLALTNA